MEYNSAIQSVENLSKAVMRLPRFMRSKFYQDFKESTYNSSDLNLEHFEKWLAKRLTEKVQSNCCNNWNTRKHKTKFFWQNKDNKYNRQQHSIFKISGNNSNTDKQQFNLKCWFCNNNDHKVSLAYQILT